LNRKILFILPVSTQPRFSKRINKFINKGFDVTVASFERQYFNLNSLPTNIEYHKLGQIKSGNYFKRLPQLIKSNFFLKKLAKHNDIIYIFSPDVLIILMPFIKRSNVHYELGDIRVLKTNTLLIKVIDYLYGKALLKCFQINVTSIKFKEYLIGKYAIQSNRINVIENKLPLNYVSSLKEQLKFKSINPEFSLGIIGLLRYRNILNFLEAYYQNVCSFKIKIYGDGPLTNEIMKFVDGERITYYGQFKNPDDLYNIYNQIDISFTMYDNSDLNVCLALPNKLYESMLFRTPIIVSSNTFLSEKVKEYGVGFDWNQYQMNELVEFMSSKKFITYYESFRPNFEIIKQNYYSEE
jgi:succinoglycan biosynthesis protein ExoL